MDNLEVSERTVADLRKQLATMAAGIVELKKLLKRAIKAWEARDAD